MNADVTERRDEPPPLPGGECCRWGPDSEGLIWAVDSYGEFYTFFRGDKWRRSTVVGLGPILLAAALVERDRELAEASSWLRELRGALEDLDCCPLLRGHISKWLAAYDARHAPAPAALSYRRISQPTD